eukprot:UN02369
MVHTQELGLQHAHTLDEWARGIDVNVVKCIGGDSLQQNIQNLQGVDVIVATEGRLMHLYKEKRFNLKNCVCIVLDEADTLLDDENSRIRQLLGEKLTRDATERQNMLFSATFTAEVESIRSSFYANRPITIEIGKRWSK